MAIEVNNELIQLHVVTADCDLDGPVTRKPLTTREENKNLKNGE